MTDAPQASGPDEELLAAALLALEQRGEVGLQELLAAHPTRAEGVRGGIERLRRMGVLAPPPAAAEPLQFGEFRVLRRLGAGGMGVVYLAEQRSLQRQVALKVVRPELLLSPTARERFQREVEAVARLQHPGIVPILAVGERDGQPWFAMEFLAGRTLEELIAAMAGKDLARSGGGVLRELAGAASSHGSGGSGVFAGSYWEACVRLVLQVAHTLVYVHERGIVHRDLKPSNVIVLPHGQAMLLDFGLAHVQDLQRVTRAEAPVGSPAYMAPEQVRGEAVDERVDVYGLAITLYQLLTARLPFPVDHAERLRAAILAGDPLPLRAGNRSVPRELAVVTAVAMDRDRERRYGTMAAFAADLEAVLARRPIRARPPGPWLRTLRFAQRHPAAAASLGAVLLVLLQFPLVLWRLQAGAAAQLRAANGELQSVVAARDRANAELVVANAESTRQRRAAQAAFDEALVAIREMQVRTGQVDLVATPGSDAVRLLLLQRAEQLFARLGALRPDDPRIDLDAARTLQHLGSLLQATGQRAAAATKFQSAIDRLASATTGPELEVRGVAEKLLALLRLGDGDLSTAEALLRTAECSLARAQAIDPFGIELRRQAAEVQNSLGLVRKDRGDLAEGVQRLEAAQAAKAELLRDAPHDPRAILAWAVGCSNLAPLLQARGRVAEAEALLADGIARLTMVRPSGADSRHHRERLAFLFDRRGSLRQDQADLTGAEADHGVALALRSELLAEFPTIAAYHNQAGASLHNLAMVRGAAGDRQESLALDNDSAERQREAVRRAPTVQQYRLHLEYALVNRCAKLLSLDRIDALAAALDELVADAVTAEGHLNAARLGARLAEQLERRGDPAAAVEALRVRAVACIAAALDKGFRDAAHFDAGTLAHNYRTLCGRPDYEAQLARLKAARR